MARLRPATRADADQIAAIYSPWVVESAVSFEIEPPGAEAMAQRTETVTATHPWLVAEEDGRVLGYAYGSRLAAPPAYRWSAETTV